jgi:predicted metal-binding membrane protein
MCPLRTWHAMASLPAERSSAREDASPPVFAPIPDDPSPPEQSGRAVDARPPGGDAGARRCLDRGTLLAGVLLGTVALLAWTVLVAQATGRGPTGPTWVAPPARATEAAPETARGACPPPAHRAAPGSLADRGEIPAGFWDEVRTLEDPFAAPCGPAAPRAAPGQSASGHRTDAHGEHPQPPWGYAAGLVLASRAASVEPGWSTDAPARVRVAIDASALAVHRWIAFLAVWGLVALAVVLPGLIPTLAAYGAARRAAAGDRRLAPHALLFALPAPVLWFLAGILVLAAREAAVAAAAASTALAARVPDALAIGLGALALGRSSPLHEGALRASRRPATLWAGRAASGYRGTLAVGWAHALASVGASAGLVAVLVLGSAALPWALAAAVLLLAERALPRGEGTGRIAGGVLLALALLAAAWPAPALGALRGTIAPPWRASGPGEAGPTLPLRRTLGGHALDVTALAFPHDDGVLASASADRTASDADTRSAAERRTGQRTTGAAGESSVLRLSLV